MLLVWLNNKPLFTLIDSISHESRDSYHSIFHDVLDPEDTILPMSEQLRIVLVTKIQTGS